MNLPKIKPSIKMRVAANGKTPVYYRVTIDRKSKYYKSGFYVQPKEFDVALGVLNTKAMAYKKINHVLVEKCLDFEVLAAKGEIRNFFDADEYFDGGTANWEFYDFAINYLAKPNKNSRVYNSQFRIAINDFNLFAPKIRLASVNNLRLRQFVDELREKGLKENTIITKLKFIKVVLNRAMEDEVLPPFKITVRIDPTPDNIKFITWKDVEKIESIIYNEYASITARRSALWFCFVTETGLRYDDLCKTVRNVQRGVDFGNEVYHTTNKTGEANPIPLTKKAKKYMELMQQDPFDVLVYSNGKYNEYLKAIQVICGIETKLTTHVARHTCATNLLNNGVALEVVQAMLGHNNRRMTERYAKIINTTLRTAIADFDLNRKGD